MKIGDSARVTPLHHLVYVILRQQISEGAYPVDTPMPSELEFSRAFNVSRITIRRALGRLQQEKLVSRARGRGTFAQAAVTPPLQASLNGTFDNLVATSLQTRVKLIDFGYVNAPAPVAAKLGVAAGTLVQKAIRIRYHHDVPFSHLTTYLPEDIGRSFEKSELSEKPLLLLLERAGVKVLHAEQLVSAKLADPIIAPLLDVEPGSALLWVKRLVIDRSNRPVEYLHALYRPDIYEYRMNMSRLSAEGSALWSADATS